MKMIQKVGVSLALLLFWGNPAFSTDDDVQELKKQVEALTRKVAELEAQSRASSSSSEQNPFQGQGRDQDSWDPFAEIDRLQEQMNRMFQEPLSPSFGPGQTIIQHQEFRGSDFDLEETGDGYLIKFPTAGMDKQKIDIEINESSITLSGESSSEQEESGPSVVMRSRSYGKFVKTIPLPVDADTGKIETEQKGDILEIRIPKKKTKT